MSHVSWAARHESTRKDRATTGRSLGPKHISRGLVCIRNCSRGRQHYLIQVLIIYLLTLRWASCPSLSMPSVPLQMLFSRWSVQKVAGLLARMDHGGLCELLNTMPSILYRLALDLP